MLHVYFDLFNALNTNVVTRASTSSGRNFNTISDIIAPRVFRIGMGWNF